MASRRGVVMGLARHHGVAVVADSRVAKGGCGSHGPACGEAETVGTRGVGAQWALLASAGETEATEGMGLVRNTMKQKNKQENYLDDWAEAQLVGRLFTMSVAGIVAAGVGVEGRKRWRSVKSGVPMRLTTSEGREARRAVEIKQSVQLGRAGLVLDSETRTIDLACAKWTLTLSVLSHPRRPRPALVKKPTCPKKTVHHANARYASVPERVSPINPTAPKARDLRTSIASQSARNAYLFESLYLLNRREVLHVHAWLEFSLACDGIRSVPVRTAYMESSTNIEGLGPGPEDTLGNRAASATEAEEVLPDTP
ncbi:hypothetical protein EDB85DRAFT_1896759 [Lactarius pseudohatsudake]|nr:hypothetical protein EDB85DRAFT_1896759 [Lactarius pseudohatsudake]